MAGGLQLTIISIEAGKKEKKNFIHYNKVFLLKKFIMLV